MMKAYVDSDVILDVLLERASFFRESSQILNLCEVLKLTGCTTALALANMHYILSCYSNNEAKKAIQTLRELLKVLPVTDREIAMSLNSRFNDFEDGVQNFVAEHNGCNLIITRNKKDYKHSLLKIVSPTEYLM